VEGLARQHRGNYYIEDSSGEVFWSWWPEVQHSGCGRLMLLNTDWTVPSNRKPVKVYTPPPAVPGRSPHRLTAPAPFDLEVIEGQALLVTCIPFGILVPKGPEPHIAILHASETHALLQVHATGCQTLRFYPGALEIGLNFQTETRQDLEIFVEGDAVQWVLLSSTHC